MTAPSRDAGPVKVQGLATSIKQITAGGVHTYALTDTGSATFWGFNKYGLLGDGNTTNRYTPIGVIGLSIRQ